jgi:amidase
MRLRHTLSSPTGALPNELVAANALQLSQWIRLRQVSCREVMSAFLGHIERVNTPANAIVSLREPAALFAQADERDAQLARGEYSGWMHGMPQAPKDLTATAGIVCTQGSPLLRNEVPKADALMAARIRAQGAIFIGKTNTPEFGLGSNTYNTVFGTTLNAYDPSRSAGGSSGGAAPSIRECRVDVPTSEWTRAGDREGDESGALKYRKRRRDFVSLARSRYGVIALVILGGLALGAMHALS